MLWKKEAGAMDATIGTAVIKKASGVTHKPCLEESPACLRDAIETAVRLAAESGARQLAARKAYVGASRPRVSLQTEMYSSLRSPLKQAPRKHARRTVVFPGPETGGLCMHGDSPEQFVSTPRQDEYAPAADVGLWPPVGYLAEYAPAAPYAAAYRSDKGRLQHCRASDSNSGSSLRAAPASGEEEHRGRSAGADCLPVREQRRNFLTARYGEYTHTVAGGKLRSPAKEKSYASPREQPQRLLRSRSLGNAGALIRLRDMLSYEPVVAALPLSSGGRSCTFSSRRYARCRSAEQLHWKHGSIDTGPATLGSLATAAPIFSQEGPTREEAAARFPPMPAVHVPAADIGSVVITDAAESTEEGERERKGKEGTGKAGGRSPPLLRCASKCTFHSKPRSETYLSPVQQRAAYRHTGRSPVRDTAGFALAITRQTGSGWVACGYPQVVSTTSTCPHTQTLVSTSHVSAAAAVETAAAAVTYEAASRSGSAPTAGKDSLLRPGVEEASSAAASRTSARASGRATLESFPSRGPNSTRCVCPAEGPPPATAETEATGVCSSAPVRGVNIGPLMAVAPAAAAVAAGSAVSLAAARARVCAARPLLPNAKADASCAFTIADKNRRGPSPPRAAAARAEIGTVASLPEPPLSPSRGLGELHGPMKENGAPSGPFQNAGTGGMSLYSTRTPKSSCGAFARSPRARLSAVRQLYQALKASNRRDQHNLASTSAEAPFFEGDIQRQITWNSRVRSRVLPRGCHAGSSAHAKSAGEGSTDGQSESPAVRLVRTAQAHRCTQTMRTERHVNAETAPNDAARKPGTSAPEKNRELAVAAMLHGRTPPASAQGSENTAPSAKRRKLTPVPVVTRISEEGSPPGKPVYNRRTLRVGAASAAVTENAVFTRNINKNARQLPPQEEGQTASCDVKATAKQAVTAKRTATPVRGARAARQRAPSGMTPGRKEVVTQSRAEARRDAKEVETREERALGKQMRAEKRMAVGLEIESGDGRIARDRHRQLPLSPNAAPQRLHAKPDETSTKRRRRPADAASQETFDTMEAPLEETVAVEGSGPAQSAANPRTVATQGAEGRKSEVPEGGLGQSSVGWGAQTEFEKEAEELRLGKRTEKDADATWWHSAGSNGPALTETREDTTSREARYHSLQKRTPTRTVASVKSRILLDETPSMTEYSGVMDTRVESSEPQNWKLATLTARGARRGATRKATIDGTDGDKASGAILAAAASRIPVAPAPCRAKKTALITAATAVGNRALVKQQHGRCLLESPPGSPVLPCLLLQKRGALKTSEQDRKTLHAFPGSAEEVLHRCAPPETVKSAVPVKTPATERAPVKHSAGSLLPSLPYRSSAELTCVRASAPAESASCVPGGRSDRCATVDLSTKKAAAALSQCSIIMNKSGAAALSRCGAAGLGSPAGAFVTPPSRDAVNVPNAAAAAAAAVSASLHAPEEMICLRGASGAALASLSERGAALPRTGEAAAETCAAAAPAYVAAPSASPGKQSDPYSFSAARAQSSAATIEAAASSRAIVSTPGAAGAAAHHMRWKGTKAQPCTQTLPGSCHYCTARPMLQHNCRRHCSLPCAYTAAPLIVCPPSRLLVCFSHAAARSRESTLPPAGQTTHLSFRAYNKTTDMHTNKPAKTPGGQPSFCGAAVPNLRSLSKALAGLSAADAARDAVGVLSANSIAELATDTALEIRKAASATAAAGESATGARAPKGSADVGCELPLASAAVGRSRAASPVERGLTAPAKEEIFSSRQQVIKESTAATLEDRSTARHSSSSYCYSSRLKGDVTDSTAGNSRTFYESGGQGSSDSGKALARTRKDSSADKDFSSVSTTLVPPATDALMTNAEGECSPHDAQGKSGSFAEEIVASLPATRTRCSSDSDPVSPAQKQHAANTNQLLQRRNSGSRRHVSAQNSCGYLVTTHLSQQLQQRHSAEQRQQQTPQLLQGNVLSQQTLSSLQTHLQPSQQQQLKPRQGCGQQRRGPPQQQHRQAPGLPQSPQEPGVQHTGGQQEHRQPTQLHQPDLLDKQQHAALAQDAQHQEAPLELRRQQPQRVEASEEQLMRQSQQQQKTTTRPIQETDDQHEEQRVRNKPQVNTEKSELYRIRTGSRYNKRQQTQEMHHKFHRKVFLREGGTATGCGDTTSHATDGQLPLASLDLPQRHQEQGSHEAGFSQEGGNIHWNNWKQTVSRQADADGRPLQQQGQQHWERRKQQQEQQQRKQQQGQQEQQQDQREHQQREEQRQQQHQQQSEEQQHSSKEQKTCTLRAERRQALLKQQHEGAGAVIQREYRHTACKARAPGLGLAHKADIRKTTTMTGQDRDRDSYSNISWPNTRRSSSWSFLPATGSFGNRESRCRSGSGNCRCTSHSSTGARDLEQSVLFSFMQRPSFEAHGAITRRPRITKVASYPCIIPAAFPVPLAAGAAAPITVATAAYLACRRTFVSDGDTGGRDASISAATKKTGGRVSDDAAAAAPEKSAAACCGAGASTGAPSAALLSLELQKRGAPAASSYTSLPGESFATHSSAPRPTRPPPPFVTVNVNDNAVNAAAVGPRSPAEGVDAAADGVASGRATTFDTFTATDDGAAAVGGRVAAAAVTAAANANAVAPHTEPGSADSASVAAVDGVAVADCLAAAHGVASGDDGAVRGTVGGDAAEVAAALYAAAAAADGNRTARTRGSPPFQRQQHAQQGGSGGAASLPVVWRSSPALNKLHRGEYTSKGMRQRATRTPELIEAAAAGAADRKAVGMKASVPLGADAGAPGDAAAPKEAHAGVTWKSSSCDEACSCMQGHADDPAATDYAEEWTGKICAAEEQQQSQVDSAVAVIVGSNTAVCSSPPLDARNRETLLLQRHNRRSSSLSGSPASHGKLQLAAGNIRPKRGRSSSCCSIRGSITAANVMHAAALSRQMAAAAAADDDGAHTVDDGTGSAVTRQAKRKATEAEQRHPALHAAPHPTMQILWGGPVYEAESPEKRLQSASQQGSCVRSHSQPQLKHLFLYEEQLPQQQQSHQQSQQQQQPPTQQRRQQRMQKQHQQHFEVTQRTQEKQSPRQLREHYQEQQQHPLLLYERDAHLAQQEQQVQPGQQQRPQHREQGLLHPQQHTLQQQSLQRHGRQQQRLPPQQQRYCQQQQPEEEQEHQVPLQQQHPDHLQQQPTTQSEPPWQHQLQQQAAQPQPLQQQLPEQQFPGQQLPGQQSPLQQRRQQQHQQQHHRQQQPPEQTCQMTAYQYEAGGCGFRLPQAMQQQRQEQLSEHFKRVANHVENEGQGVPLGLQQQRQQLLDLQSPGLSEEQQQLQLRETLCQQPSPIVGAILMGQQQQQQQQLYQVHRSPQLQSQQQQSPRQLQQHRFSVRQDASSQDVTPTHLLLRQRQQQKKHMSTSGELQEEEPSTLHSLQQMLNPPHTPVFLCEAQLTPELLLQQQQFHLLQRQQQQQQRHQQQPQRSRSLQHQQLLQCVYGADKDYAAAAASVRTQRRCHSEPRASVRGPVGKQQAPEFANPAASATPANRSWLPAAAIAAAAATYEDDSAFCRYPPHRDDYSSRTYEADKHAGASAVHTQVGRSTLPPRRALLYTPPATAACSLVTGVAADVPNDEVMLQQQKPTEAASATAMAEEGGADWAARVEAAKQRTRDRLQHMLEEDKQLFFGGTACGDCRTLSRCCSSFWCRCCCRCWCDKWKSLTVAQRQRCRAATIWLLTGMLLALCGVAMLCIVVMRWLLPPAVEA